MRRRLHTGEHSSRALDCAETAARLKDAVACSAGTRLARLAGVVAGAAAIAVLVLSESASARVDFASRPSTVDTFWGVELSGSTVAMLTDATARRARAAGVNAVLIDNATLSPRRWKRVTAIVKRFHFKPLFLARGITTATRAESLCARAKHRDPAKVCALVSTTLRGALRLAAAPSLDVVIVRMRAPESPKVVRSTATHARILALVELRHTGRIDRPAWRGLIMRAARDPSFDLGVVPVGPRKTAAFTTFLNMLSASDVSPPTSPTAVSLVDSTPTSLRLAWNTASDDHGVTEYGVYRSDVLVRSTQEPTVLLNGLSCGTTYLLAIDAADAAGNRSPTSVLSAATEACGPAGPGPVDAKPPTTPTSFAATASTTSTISLIWTAASDDVGVAGYDLYLGPTPIGETPATTATVRGLICNTRYTVSIDAYDAAGNRSPRTFLTVWTSDCPEPDTTPPSDPTGLSTSVTATAITLAWTAAGDNVGVAGYGMQLDGHQVGTAQGESYAFTGLACGTTYTVGVQAYDATGNGSDVASVVATTGACPIADSTKPTTPADLRTTAAERTTISLAWTAATDNVGVEGYGVYVGSSLVGSTSSTTFTVIGLTCGTSYTFSVVAYDAAGNRSAKTQVAAGTASCPAPDTSPPSVPGGFAVAASSQTSMTLTWNPSTDNVGVVGYRVYSGSISRGTTSSTSFTVTGLSCGTSYRFGVEAFDADGNRSAKAGLDASTAACPAADTTAPTVPTGLRVSGATQTALTLSWDPSTDSVAVAGYGRYRNGVLVSQGGETSFTFTGLTCGTTYSTGVDAYDAAGNRSAKALVTVTTAACPDTKAPSAPTRLTASGATRSSITLSWSASVDDVAVIGYGRFRNDSLVSSGTETSFTFTGLSCGTSYTLAVDAYDAAGNRSPKAQSLASTTACPPDSTAPSTPAGLRLAASTQTSITLAWLASTDNVGVGGYTVYNGITALGNTASLTFTVSGLTCGTSYSLAVDAYDAAANRSAKAVISTSTSPCPDLSPPSPPANLVASATTPGSVTLSWTASLDNVGVAGYTVYNGGAGVATATSTSFTLSGLTCGTSYSLAVDAYDAAGNHSAKASIDASTSACASPPTAGPGANLWVDPNGGSCLRSAALVAYVDSQACSWNQAYQASQTGDLVVIKGGSYGDVSIGPNRTAIASPGVVFRSASGESVVLRDFTNGAYQNNGGGGNNITFVGPVRARSFQADYTTNVTVDNWDVDVGGQQITQPFHVEFAANFTLRNSKVHNALNSNAMMVLGGSNFTFDNNDIYDDLNNTGGAIHDECFRAQPVTGMTMTRNHFWSCNVMDVFITDSETASNWIVENNIFEAPTGSSGNAANAFAFRAGGTPSPAPDGFVLRYNTFGSSGVQINGVDNPPTARGFTVTGNYFATNAPCGLPNTSYSYNVTPSGTNNCGGTGALSFALSALTSGFTRYQPFTGNGGASPQPAGDYRLLTTSPLIDKGNPNSYPTTDRSGTNRYKGTAPDTGAYEAG
jgi:chitodextrinase